MTSCQRDTLTWVCFTAMRAFLTPYWKSIYYYYSYSCLLLSPHMTPLLTCHILLALPTFLAHTFQDAFCLSFKAKHTVSFYGVYGVFR